MYQKYEPFNGGEITVENSCSLHNDGKGFDFRIINNENSFIIIVAKTEKNENGKYETNIKVEEKADLEEDKKYDLTFTTSDEVNPEKIYERFEEEYSNGSEKTWNEIFEEFPFFTETEKISGKMHNSLIWNELKELDNVQLEISQDWKFNLDKDFHDIYIKNEKENLKFHSEGGIDWYYKEKRIPEEKTIEIINASNYNTPSFIITINDKNNISFNYETMEKIAAKKNFCSKEDVNIFISKLRECMPSTQISGKATALMKNSLLKIIEQAQEKQEVKNNRPVR
jgi:hypothetical protein